MTAPLFTAVFVGWASLAMPAAALTSADFLLHLCDSDDASEIDSDDCFKEQADRRKSKPPAGACVCALGGWSLSGPWVGAGGSWVVRGWYSLK